MQAVKEEEELPPPLPAEAPPRPPAAAPVSKWTLVDYDEDNPPADLDGYASLAATLNLVVLKWLSEHTLLAEQDTACSIAGRTARPVFKPPG